MQAKIKNFLLIFSGMLALSISLSPPISADHGLDVAGCANLYQEGGVDWEHSAGYLECVAHAEADAAAASTALDVNCDVNADGEFDCFSDDFSENEFAPGANPIYIRLNQFINFLSIGIGVVITISVIASAIQWTTSGGEPQRRAKAVGRLWNTAIALILFIFGWLLLNWLIPGGVLSGDEDVPTSQNTGTGGGGGGLNPL